MATIPTVEQLLDQASSYDLGDGLALGRRQEGRWFVYVDGVEVHFRAGHGIDSHRPFERVQDALAYLQTASGLKVVERARARRMPAAPAQVE